MGQEALTQFLETFTSYGRRSVVPVYYYPQPGEKRGRYQPRRQPFTPRDIQQHVASTDPKTPGTPLGLYLLDPAYPGRTRIACVDLDDHEKKLSLTQICQAAVALRKNLAKEGMVAWACTSGSGHGVHLWVFWQDPQDAQVVKAALNRAVEASKLPCKYDIYPTASHLDETRGGLGSLVALPLGRGSRPIVDLEVPELQQDLEKWLPVSLPLSRPLSVLDTDELEEDAGRGGDLDKRDQDFGPADPDYVRSALSALENDDYHFWVKVGHCLKGGVRTGKLTDSQAFELWDEWSRGSDKYEEGKMDKKWRDLGDSRSVSLGSIFYFAEARGWVKPERKKLSQVAKQEVKQEALTSSLDDGTDLGSAVKKLNERYFVCTSGGKTLVYHEGYNFVLRQKQLYHLGVTDFKNYLSNKNVIVGYKDKVPVMMKLGQAWFEHKDRRTYQQIAMLPDVKPSELPDVYNLYKGWQVQPSPTGSCELFKKHVLDNLCSGNRECYDFIMGWTAQLIQRPWEVAQSALVFRGEEGTGKGSFAKVLRRLCSPYFLQLDKAHSVTGHFNSHLEGKLVVFGDEAIWAGNRGEEGTLKSLITEDIIQIEPKGRDSYMSRNMIHLLMATNNEWSVPAGLSARRFLALKVSDARRQDEEYFDNIFHQLQEGGYEKLMHELLHWDLSTYNPRNPPRTDELLTQKILKMSAFESWWFNRLNSGSPLDHHTLGWNERLPVTVAFHDFKVCSKSDGARGLTASEKSFMIQLRAILPPDVQTSRTQLDRSYEYGDRTFNKGTKVTFIHLPPLKECQDFFCKKIQQPVAWDSRNDPQPTDQQVMKLNRRDEEEIEI